MNVGGIERLRVDLDERGEGEAPYRVRAGKWEFHFFVLSRQLDEASGRLIAILLHRWTVIVAASAKGTWTPEREAFLREEAV